MSEGKEKYNKTWYWRPTTWIVTYFTVGLILSITTLFTSHGDLPNATTFGKMFADLPNSAGDLILATWFWIIMPAVMWPLTLLFQIIFSFSR